MIKVEFIKKRFLRGWGEVEKLIKENLSDEEVKEIEEIKEEVYFDLWEYEELEKDEDERMEKLNGEVEDMEYYEIEEIIDELKFRLKKFLK